MVLSHLKHRPCSTHKAKMRRKKNEEKDDKYTRAKNINIVIIIRKHTEELLSPSFSFPYSYFI